MRHLSFYVAAAALVIAAVTASNPVRGQSANSTSEALDEASRATLNACFAAMHAPAIDYEPCESAQRLVQLDQLWRARVDSALAILFARSGQLQQARPLMDNAVAGAPDDVTLLVNYANLFIYEGKFVDAVETLDRAVAAASDAELPYIYFNRALALRGVGRYDEAEADFIAYERALAQTSSAPTRGLDLEGSSLRDGDRTSIPVEDLN